MVIRFVNESQLKCEGYGAISMVNLANLYRIIGVNVTTSNSTICNPEAPYTFLEVTPGDETEIIQNGNCYQISVKNCEILKATERFMLEGFVKIEESKIKD
jgi:hypothetical protein